MYLSKSPKLAEILGFEPKDYNGSMEYCAEKRINTFGERYIYILSEELQRNIKTSENKGLSPFCKITFNDLDNGVKFHVTDSERPELVIFNPPKSSIKDLDIQFKIHGDHLYDFEGIDHSLTFIVTESRSSKTKFKTV